MRDRWLKAGAPGPRTLVSQRVGELQGQGQCARPSEEAHRGPGKGQNSRGRWWQRLKQRGSEAPEIGSCWAGNSGVRREEASRVGCEGQEAGSRLSVSACLPNWVPTKGWTEQAAGRKRKDGTAPQGQQWVLFF